MREVIKGCAGEVMGEIAERVFGSVVLFGKRMGEMKGLGMLARANMFGQDGPTGS